MNELLSQLNEQMAELPQWIHYWMRWMMFIFLTSIVFVRKLKAPRYILLTFILTMPMGMLVFYMTKHAHLLGITHLILWAPLLIGLIKYELKREDFKFKSIYGLWLSLLIVTISISLAFDIVDIIMVLTGHK